MDAVNENYKIRPAELDDVPEIFVLIKELADYERLLDEVVATEELAKPTPQKENSSWLTLPGIFSTHGTWSPVHLLLISL